MTTEPEIELDCDTATQRLRMLSVVRAPDGSRNEFAARGWYIDTLKRTEDGWLYHHHQAMLDLAIDKVFAKMGVTEAFAKLAEN